MDTDREPGYFMYIVTAAVFACGAIAYFVPVASTAAGVAPAAHHVRLALSVIMAASFCGSAILYLLGVRIFTPKLRVAYRWFAAGNIVFAAAMLQWPLVVATGQETSWWAVSGAIIVPFLLGTFLMYVGMRRFALLLGVRSKVMSKRFTTLAVAGAAIVSGLAAHVLATNNTPGIDTETYTAVVAWTTGYGLAALLLIYKTARSIGPSYQRAMNWQVAALAMLSLSGLHEYVTSYFLTEAQGYIYWGISLWPFIVASFLFLGAGYIMWRARYAGRAAPKANNESAGDRGSIDDIMNVVGLVSRPERVDPIMDGLRAVTASIQTGVPLTERQRDQLVQVYSGLEDYLVTSDPVRRFSRAELRTYLTSELHQRVNRELPIEQYKEEQAHANTV